MANARTNPVVTTEPVLSVVSGSSKVFKFIKKTDFIVDGANHSVYVLAYKGRILTLNTLNLVDCPELTYKLEGSTFTIYGKFTVVIVPYVDVATQATRQGATIMAKNDLEVDAW